MSKANVVQSDLELQINESHETWPNCTNKTSQTQKHTHCTVCSYELHKQAKLTSGFRACDAVILFGGGWQVPGGVKAPLWHRLVWLFLMVLRLCIYDLRDFLDIYYTSIVYPFCTGIITCHVIHIAVPSHTCLFHGCVNSWGSERWNHSPVVLAIVSGKM